MLTLLLSASIVLLIDPPEPLRCGLPGVTVRTADGAEIHAARAEYLPASLGIVVVPVIPGRVYCNGFEA
jgi:hypothetical protein